MADLRGERLLLSRTASPGARGEVTRHADWTLLDAEDLSRVVRNELPLESARRLVETYFPGWREAFLGLPEPGPWLTADEFFAPFASRSHSFSHAWTMVGRSAELDELVSLARGDGRRVVVVAGRGGSGKSRFLRALAGRVAAAVPGVPVRFVSPAVEVQPRHVEELPASPALVVVDDAHDRSDLPALLPAVALLRPDTRLVLATRPYGLPALGDDLTRTGWDGGDQVRDLGNLPIEDVEALSLEVLGELGGPAHLAGPIAQVTSNSPLATVVGSRLVAEERIDPRLLANEASFRAELLRVFRDAIVGDFGDASERRGLRDLLNVVALVQPVTATADGFGRTAERITGVPADRVVRRHLQHFEDAGVLLRRGRTLRIVPDLLADYLVGEACWDDRSGTPTGFADRVFGSLSACSASPTSPSATPASASRTSTWRRRTTRRTRASPPPSRSSCEGSPPASSTWRRPATSCGSSGRVTTNP